MDLFPKKKLHIRWLYICKDVYAYYVYHISITTALGPRGITSAMRPPCFYLGAWPMSLTRSLSCLALHLGKPRQLGLGPWFISQVVTVIELDYGKIYRKFLYLIVKTMVSCRFSLKPIQWYWIDCHWGYLWLHTIRSFWGNFRIKFANPMAPMAHPRRFIASDCWIYEWENSNRLLLLSITNTITIT